ncbi:hypothetical protein DFH09DRAFT_1096060 [Mycena vulgaris]|nr:hypothetical protein DFH09DRAFT_1096060 [Mycena vulgaris]
MSTTDSAPPDTLHPQCCNDSPGEGCGIMFPGKTSDGLCQKCTLLDSLDPKSEKYSKALEFLQCMTCGVAWKRLPFTDQCGPCHQNGLINHGLQVAQAARGNAFNVRLHRGPKQNALAATPVQPTLELNTAALDQFRNVGYNDADCIKVYAEPRLVSKIEHRLGSTSRAYAPETPMSEITGDLLVGWNNVWLKKHIFPLVLDESELRFHGNQNPLPDSQHLAVLDFYQVHRNAGNHEAYFTKMPKHAASMKGKVIAIELWMDGEGPGAVSSKSGPISSVKKRKSVAGKAPAEVEAPSKRPRISGSIGTSFVCQLPGPDPAKSTAIALLFPTISVDHEKCNVKVVWSDTATPTTEAAVIANEIFHSGKMKHCYKLSIGDEQFVAKRFFETGRGEDQVTLEENATNLESELVRAENARWFLKSFRTAAEEINLVTAQNFEITQCRIAQEVVEGDAKPSPASGLTSEGDIQKACENELNPVELPSQDPGDQFEGGSKERSVSGIPLPPTSWSEPAPTKKIIWLLEPLRNAAVTHYTGTMEHPAGTGQLAHTLSAFVHYAFQASGGDILFADVQGSSGRLSNKNMGIIIFDLMTHSPDENTGVGDYGPAGIRLGLEVGDDDEEEE